MYVHSENGNINGYHKRGVLEDGVVKYSIDDEFVNGFRHNRLTDTTEPLRIHNPHRKMIKMKDYQVDKKSLSDHELIDHCENELHGTSVYREARRLRRRLRDTLETDPHEEILRDFKTLIQLLDDAPRNQTTIKRLSDLIDKYK